MTIPLYGPKVRFFDNNGDPLAGGKVYSYEAGTSTPKNTYTDSTGSTANANPVILDADGYANIWLDTGDYKIVLTDADDVTIFTTDDVPGAVTILSQITSASSSSVAIATGTKTFTIEANKAFPVGGFVIITYDVDPTNYMFGQVTDYTGTTLEVDVTTFGGSGTYNIWTVSVSGPQGATGATGPGGGGTGDMLGASNLQQGVGGVANTATARANLGLGSAALLDAGTSANQVVQLDGSGNLPAVNGSALTNLDASDLASGTVPTARLGSGSASSSTFLRGDQTWAAATGPTTTYDIGTYAILKVSTTVNSGSTVSGSNKTSTYWSSDAVPVLTSDGNTPSGTWRNMGGTLTSGRYGLFLRIS